MAFREVALSMVAAFGLMGCPHGAVSRPDGSVTDGGARDAGTDAGALDAGCVGAACTDAGLPTTVTVSVTARRAGHLMAVVPSWVVWRDGAGDWTALAGTDGGYALPVTAQDGRYSLAVVCPEGKSGNHHVMVYEATLAELPRITADFCEEPPGAPVPLWAQTLTTSGWPGASTFATVSYGNAHAVFTESPSSQVLEVPAGMHDVLALVGHSDTALVRDGFLLLHDIGVDAAGARAFDFGAGAALQTFQLSLGGATADDTAPSIDVGLYTGDGSAHSLVGQSANGQSAYRIPSAALGPKDLHKLQVATGGPDGKRRSAFKVLHAPVDVMLVPPLFLTSASAKSTATSPYARAEFAWSGAPKNSAMFFAAQQGLKAAYMLVTPGALAGRVSFAHPDLSGVSGWNNAWGLATGMPTDYAIFALSGSPGFDVLLQAFENFGVSVEGTEGFVTQQSGSVAL